MTSGDGLPYWPTHQQMWDRYLFGIDPNGLAAVVRPGQSAERLGLTRTGLNHLDDKPSFDAIHWRWQTYIQSTE